VVTWRTGGFSPQWVGHPPVNSCAVDGLGDSDDDGLSDGLTDGDADSDGLTDGLTDGDADADGLRDGETEADGEAEDDGDTLALGLTDASLAGAHSRTHVTSTWSPSAVSQIARLDQSVTAFRSPVVRMKTWFSSASG
jgi:hypothetical protein